MYKKGINFAGFIFFFVTILWMGSETIKATSIDKAKQEKKALEQKKEDEEKQREEILTKQKTVESSIKELDQAAEEILDTLETIGENISENEKNITKLKYEIQEADKVSKKHYNTMKRRIRYMYENNDVNYLDVFLGSNSIEDLLNHAEYMGAISDYDNSLLDRYTASIAHAKFKKEEREEETRKLEKNRELADLELQKNKELSKEKEGVFKQYSDLIKGYDSSISEYTDEITEKENYIDQLIKEEEKRKAEARRREEERKKALALLKQKQEANKKKNATATGTISKTGFMWPLPGYATISSGFGYRGVIIKGGGTFHKGIDVPAPLGSNIVASLEGSVVSAGYHYAMGNHVLLNHGDGLYTVYMHASKLLVRSGDYVQRGQKIALVGSTGFSTGPHLHFGVKVNGVYYNPLNYVSQ